MEAQFWHERWAEKQIGFHQEKVNKRLQYYWSALELAPEAKVFVPLCGKSIDMLWLHEQGHPVLGVELDATAVEAFFTENQLTYTVLEQEGFVQYHGTGAAEGIQLWVGDFFTLTTEHLSEFTGFYDRASMIAMPPRMRSDYTKQLGRVIKPGVCGLVITITYDQERMKGPPFSIPDEDFRHLLTGDYDINELACHTGPKVVGNLVKRGLETMEERVYLLKRNN